MYSMLTVQIISLHNFLYYRYTSQFSSDASTARSCRATHLNWTEQLHEIPNMFRTENWSKILLRYRSCRQTHLNWTELNCSVQFSSVQMRLRYRSCRATHLNWTVQFSSDASPVSFMSSDASEQFSSVQFRCVARPERSLSFFICIARRELIGVRFK